MARAYPQNRPQLSNVLHPTSCCIAGKNPVGTRLPSETFPFYGPDDTLRKCF